MKLLDLNLLLYAADETTAHHRVARPWLEQQLSGSETIALPWAVLLGFIRLTTKRQLMADPFSVDEAIGLVEEWLSRPNTVVVHPTDRHAAILRELLAPLGAGGNLTTDAHLAALAIEHGAELCSADADFARFPRLRWVNPLTAVGEQEDA